MKKPQMKFLSSSYKVHDVRDSDHKLGETIIHFCLGIKVFTLSCKFHPARIIESVGKVWEKQSRQTLFP